MIDPLSIQDARLPLATTRPSQDAISIGRNFGSILQETMDGLNRQHAVVHHMNEQFILGNLEDTHQLMLEAQKASLGLELTVELRNKVVEAYQEMMRLQI